MAVRPSDWFLVDYSSDPTPGDAFGIRSLAAKYADIATIAGDASDGVTRARSSGAASGWVGDAGDIFRDKSHRMPGELAKANDSYSMVADALRSWAESVDDTQAQADRGLQQAREAHADLASAQAALGSAQSSWSTVHAQQLSYQKLTKDYASVPPPSNVTMPTDYQVRSADRSAQQAQSSISAAQGRIADADARLAAAKALVNAAKQRRDDAERTIVHKIGSAEDHAVKPSSIWEAIQDSAAWQAVVVIATVVLTIVTIVAIFVGGPLVWALIIAATVLLMVNALMSIAQGKDAWGELIMLGIGLIPGGRLLALGGKLVMGISRLGEAGMRIAGAITRVTDTISRVGATTVRVVQSLADRAATAVTEAGARAALALRILTAKASLAAHLTFGHLGGGVEQVGSATSIHNLWAFGDPRLGPLNPPAFGPVGHFIEGLHQPQTMADAQSYLAEFHNLPGGKFDFPTSTGFTNNVSGVHTWQPGDILGRVGGEHGAYLAEPSVTFPQEALPLSNLNPYKPNLDLHAYEVVHPFASNYGPIAPNRITLPGGNQLQLDAGLTTGINSVRGMLFHGLIREVDLGVLPALLPPIPDILRIPLP